MNPTVAAFRCSKQRVPRLRADDGEGPRGDPRTPTLPLCAQVNTAEEGVERASTEIIDA